MKTIKWTRKREKNSKFILSSMQSHCLSKSTTALLLLPDHVMPEHHCLAVPFGTLPQCLARARGRESLALLLLLMTRQSLTEALVVEACCELSKGEIGKERREGASQREVESSKAGGSRERLSAAKKENLTLWLSNWSIFHKRRENISCLFGGQNIC